LQSFCGVYSVDFSEVALAWWITNNASKPSLTKIFAAAVFECHPFRILGSMYFQARLDDRSSNIFLLDIRSLHMDSAPRTMFDMLLSSRQRPVNVVFPPGKTYGSTLEEFPALYTKLDMLPNIRP